jgi:hypothetical protein
MPKNRQDTSEAHVVEGREAFAAAAAEVARRARLELALLSFDLPAWAYGTPAFCDAVRDLILRYQRARVRVLIHDVYTVTSRDHRLIHLLRDLDSYTEIRKLAEHQGDHREDCLIADEHHLLKRDTPEALTAVVRYDSPLDGRAAYRDFDQLWDGSEPASELRRLHL